MGQQTKELGEIVSEQGHQVQALAYLDQALVQAILAGEPRSAVNILGHRLHIFKKLYTDSSNEDFMEMFYADVLAGLRLCEKNQIDGQPKSVMLLRAGDYFLFKQDFIEALKRYHQALEELNKNSKEAEETRAEYMSHYAEGLSQSGRPDDALRLFSEALEILQKNHKLRPFHHMIIESGVLLRQAQTLAVLGEDQRAHSTLHTAKQIADKLATEHNMPARQQQADRLAKKYKWHLTS